MNDSHISKNNKLEEKIKEIGTPNQIEKPESYTPNELNVNKDSLYSSIQMELIGEWRTLIESKRTIKDKANTMVKYFFVMHERDPELYQKINSEIKGRLRDITYTMEKLTDINEFLNYFKNKYSELGEERSERLKNILEEYIRKEGLEERIRAVIADKYARELTRIENGEEIIKEGWKDFYEVSLKEYLSAKEEMRPSYIKVIS